MKIVKVDIMRLIPNRPKWAEGGEGDKINWANFDKGCRPIVCRIYTDEGLYGDGEAGFPVGIGGEAACYLIRDFANMIIGMDPLDTEVIWNKFYRDGYFTQSGGVLIYGAISALDMALWDIKGKYFNVPIAKLLGGSKRTELRAYASQLQFGWGKESKPAFKTQDYVDNALLAVADGYDAIKIDFFTLDQDGSGFTDEQRCGLLHPKHIDLVEERVAAVREAVGPKVDIIVEAHSFTDALAAVQIGQRIEKYNIFYYEEPCTPTPKLQRYMKDNVNIPMASGERIFSRWQYAPYIEDMSLQVLQPDLTTCGGISEAKKISDMAYIYDIGIQIHVCGTPLSLAAALNIESVIPNFTIHEHHVIQFREYMEELVTTNYEPKNGKFGLPTLPGIGTELSEYALTHCDKITVAR
jgi:L-alanine-DL-glutamate epimerase-like enolase superfamily enzyme